MRSRDNGFGSYGTGAVGAIPKTSALLKLIRKLVPVLGGAGLLRSHICQHLFSRGIDVLCVKSHSTSRKDNIAHLLDKPDFETVWQDITFPLDVARDESSNLACRAATGHCQQGPDHTTDTIVIGGTTIGGLAKSGTACILRLLAPKWVATATRSRCNQPSGRKVSDDLIGTGL